MLQLSQIDRASDRPPYRQIAALLRKSIEEGCYGPGAQLPSEAELIKHFGVARMTVRNALKELHSARLIFSQHGRGVFVCAQPRPTSDTAMPAAVHCTDRGTGCGLADKYPLAVRIRRWREEARRVAQEAMLVHHRGDEDRTVANATRASMYFALALDAKHFGDLPEPNENQDPEVPPPLRRLPNQV